MTHARLLVIVNRVAAKARHAVPTVRQRLLESGIDFDLYETTKAGDATTKTSAALKDGYETIAVVGGDGTLSESASGFFDLPASQSEEGVVQINPAAALAILPAGTGDDFARGLTGQRSPVEVWIERLINHCRQSAPETTRLIDVLDATCDKYARRFICLNAATMGIGGETGARVAAQGTMMRFFSGEIRFMAAAVGALAAWRERPVRVSVDENQIVEGSMNLVAVANGLFAGGGMMLSPEASVDDGKLDVVTASGLSRVNVVRELPRIHSGGHVANPKVKVLRGRQVRIETFGEDDGLLIEADGNVRGRTPAEFRVVPGALRFVV